jgi:hypothetical protein
MSEKRAVRKIAREKKPEWKWVKVYVTKAEARMIERRASKAHLSVSDHVRKVIREAVGIDREKH